MKFAIYKSRYCNSHHCDNCPIYEECDNEENSRAAAKIVKVVEKWAKENPAKARASEFLKICPRASVDDNGILKISPCVADIIRYSSRTCDGSCTQCRYDFWQEKAD